MKSSRQTAKITLYHDTGRLVPKHSIPVQAPRLHISFTSSTSRRNKTRVRIVKTSKSPSQSIAVSTAVSLLSCCLFFLDLWEAGLSKLYTPRGRVQRCIFESNSFRIPQIKHIKLYQKLISWPFLPDVRNKNTCINMGLDTSSEAFVFQANKLFSPNVLRVQQGRAPSL